MLTGFWRLYVHGGVALLGILCWGMWKKGIPRLAGTVVLALGSIPVLIRLTGTRRSFLQDEFLLYAPGCIAMLGAIVLIQRSQETLYTWGAGLGDWAWWAPRVGLAIILMVPIVYTVMLFDPALASYYPVWKAARTDFVVLLWALLGVGLDMLGWEFLFRGALLFGMARRGDVHMAIWLQVFPFFLLHSEKPYSELVLSIFGGLLSGWFCWRARCFWPLFILHWLQLSLVNIFGFVL